MRISLESGDPYLIRCLTSDGFGPALLPASIARREGPPVDTRPLDPPLLLPVYLAWRRGRRHSPAAEAFVDFVRNSAGGAHSSAKGAHERRVSPRATQA